MRYRGEILELLLMFLSGIPLVPRDLNFEQYANLVAEKRSEMFFYFEFQAYLLFPSLLESTIQPVQYKNRSSTNRRLFRVLCCFEVLGGLAIHILFPHYARDTCWLESGLRSFPHSG